MMAAFCFLPYILLLWTLHALNYTKCPGPLEIQTKDVQLNFDPSLLGGIYYEIAFHDYTQDCKDASCMRSVKHYVQNNSMNAVIDDFTIQCPPGPAHPSEFVFNITSIPGFFTSYVVGIDQTSYPDTVVAMGPVIDHDTESKKSQYEWVIEFQCLDDQTQIIFVGINFYVYINDPAQSLMDQMINIAYQQGLGVYLDRDLRYADQKNCSYPPTL